MKVNQSFFFFNYVVWKEDNIRNKKAWKTDWLVQPNDIKSSQNTGISAKMLKQNMRLCLLVCFQ